MQRISLQTPPLFHFWATVGSHGWCALPPFSYDDERRCLYRWERLSDGAVVRLSLTASSADALQAQVEGISTPLTPAQAAEITALIDRMLGFDHDPAPFHQLVRDDPHYGWITRAGAGRMLASPTVWEDLAKTLMTTNTTWAMTKGMVQRLNMLGDPAADSVWLFPTPAQIAAYTPDALNQHIRAGYRGPYLHALAVDICEGRFDPEALRDPSLTSQEVYKRLKSLRGFGDYAAGAMMRLLGRFDALGLDSECRSAYARHHNAGNPATDREIAAFYARFGAWQGLAVWMDVMREDMMGSMEKGEHPDAL